MRKAKTKAEASTPILVMSGATRSKRPLRDMQKRPVDNSGGTPHHPLPVMEGVATDFAATLAKSTGKLLSHH